MDVRLYPENKEGLPTIYNRAIKDFGGDPCLFIFAHDDLLILDFCWINTILNGLSHFGIVGVAGNKRRVAFQSSWAFIDQNFTWDNPENLSGIVGHGASFPPPNLSIFGPPYQEVKLLDGVILCGLSETLIKNNLQFDERFKFHFYDLDFCRQAESAGVSMGTIPLSIIHESGGSFGSEDWRLSYETYMKKWGS